MKFDITIKSKVLNLKPIELDTKFIEKIVKKEKNTPIQYPNIFLIYGDNGVGKTTLSECLRTKDQDNHYDIKQIDLGLFENSEFHVYNRHFVSQNVHNMNKMVNTDKLTSVVIGQKIISLAENLDRAASERLTTENQLSKLGTLLNSTDMEYSKINTELIVDLTDQYKEFLLKTDTDLKILIEKNKKSLPTEENTIPQNITLLEEFPLFIIPQNEITELLSKKNRILEKDREEEIFQFCNFLSNQREWYNIGLQSLDYTDSLCPFCHQSLASINTQRLIEDYKIALQNKEIEDLKNSIKLLLSKINKQDYTLISEKNKISYKTAQYQKK